MLRFKIRSADLPIRPSANFFITLLDLAITRGKAVNLQFQILDAFGSYPLDMNGIMTPVPKDWWTKRAHRPDQ